MSDQSQFMLIQQGMAIYDFVHVHYLLLLLLPLVSNQFERGIYSGSLLAVKIKFT